MPASARQRVAFAVVATALLVGLAIDDETLISQESFEVTLSLRG